MAKLRKNKYKKLINEHFAKISAYDGECFLDTDTDVMGIQIHFAGKAVITPTLPDGWVMQGNNNIMLMFALQNVPIQKQLLFTYKGEVKISKCIISDSEGLKLNGYIERDYAYWKSQRFSFDVEADTWDNFKNKSKNASIKKTSYNLPNYNLPKVKKTKKITRKVQETPRSTGGY